MSVKASFLTPFWLSPIMHEESIFFVDRGDGDPWAGLVFPPAAVLSLTTASRQQAYEEGRDYAIDRPRGRVRRLSGSRMPITALEELYPADEPRVMIADGDEFHRRQSVITYAHTSADGSNDVTEFAGAQLPRTAARLLAGQPLTLCVSGDSISEGYNASGFVEAPPFQPPYATLVAQGVALAYGSQIDLQNFAVAGWTADHGRADVKRVAAAHPHLVVIAYGMNDAGYAEPNDYSSNITGIIEGVRRSSPDAEFVLVSPMLPNVSWDYPAMHRFPAYCGALARLCGEGVILADVTTRWAALLPRKSVHDLTGNGINHPNDFGHRIYAHVILSRLVERHRLTAFARADREDERSADGAPAR